MFSSIFFILFFGNLYARCSPTEYYEIMWFGLHKKFSRKHTPKATNENIDIGIGYAMKWEMKIIKIRILWRNDVRSMAPMQPCRAYTKNRQSSFVLVLLKWFVQCFFFSLASNLYAVQVRFIHSLDRWRLQLASSCWTFPYSKRVCIEQF